MQVQLEVLVVADDTLVGTAVWADGSANAHFHGTLELVRVLQQAAGERSGPDAEQRVELMSSSPGGATSVPSPPPMEEDAR